MKSLFTDSLMWLTAKIRIFIIYKLVIKNNIMSFFEK